MAFFEEFLQLRSQVAGYITEFDEVYGKLKSRGEPSALKVLFPIVYKRALERTNLSSPFDRKIVTFISQYFSTRNPELCDYFIGKDQRESLETMRELITKHMEGSK
jgi:hypothetical protein